MEFKISESELIDVFEVGALMRLSFYQRRVRFKDANKCSSVDFLIYHLLKGNDISKHYTPKHPDDYLMNVLRGNMSHIIPYHAIYEDCLHYLSHVPVKNKVGNVSWDTAGYKIDKLRSVSSNFYGIYYDTLINLRPHVKRLYNKVIDTYNIRM